VRTLVALTLTAASSLLAIAGPTAAPATAATTVQVRLQTAISNLPVAAEVRTGYDRAKFPHWVDANGDCQDTRDEVLQAESRVSTSGCDIRTGRWYSYYDNRTFTSASDLDIDHLVALAEAWDSGARRWTTDTRKRFANDLGDSRSLVAVSASSNRSKSDRDPAQWMPVYGQCLPNVPAPKRGDGAGGSSGCRVPWMLRRPGGAVGIRACC